MPNHVGLCASEGDGSALGQEPQLVCAPVAISCIPERMLVSHTLIHAAPKDQGAQALGSWLCPRQSDILA